MSRGRNMDSVSLLKLNFVCCMHMAVLPHHVLCIIATTRYYAFSPQQIISCLKVVVVLFKVNFKINFVLDLLEKVVAK